MTLLTIATAIADEVGFPRPASVVGSTDDGVRQLHALLNREGHFLVRGAGYGHEWGACLRDKSVTVTSGTDTYAVPTDCLKIVNDTIWDTTNDWPMLGPLSSQEWERLKRGYTVTGPRKRWRLVGEADGVYASAATAYNVQIDPVPTNSTDTFFYEYTTTGFARQNSDTAAGVFDHDSDNPILPEQLFILGGIYRWRKAKRLSYAEEKAEYDAYLETAIAQDRAARKLSISRRPMMGPHFLDVFNVPESGFGV